MSISSPDSVAPALERNLEWFFDHVLVRVVQGLFYLLLMVPGMVAAVIGMTTGLAGPSSSALWFIVNRLDSGMQLGLGSFLVRSWVVVIVLLVLLLGVRLPRPSRGLWGATLLFHGIALLSGALSSHPYEAMLTAFDTALLNVVVLLACVAVPAEWLPRCILGSGFLVSFVSLFIFMEQAAGEVSPRLSGTFHQPNMTAAYVACCLPWLLNQELPRRREWWGAVTQWLCVVAAVFLLLTLGFTQTRAAWLAALLGLSYRWWLGARLRRSPWRWRFPVEAAVASAVTLLLLIVAAQSTVWALVPAALWLLTGAWLSGATRRTLVLLAGIGLLVALAGFQARSLAGGPPTQAGPSRVQDLAEARDPSLHARLEFWRASLLMGAEHSLLGVGPRGFHRYYPRYQLDERWFSKFAHSALISVWAELGILGSLGLLLVLIMVVRTWIAGLHHPDPEHRLRLLDGITGCAILSMCAAVDVQWQFPLLPITWAAWLGYSLSQCWPPETPAPVSAEAPVSAWTLRPHVVLTYFFVALFGVVLFWNLIWTFAHYHHEVGDMALQRGRFQDANLLSRRAVELNPFQGSYYHQLGLAQLAARANKADSVPAKELMRSALGAVRLDSHRAVHWDLLAKAHLAAGDIPKLQEAIRRALQCDPVNYPSFYTALAESYPVPQNRSERMLLMMACMYRFPPAALGSMFTFRSEDIQRQLVSVYLHLADLSNAAGQPQQALFYYDRLLKIQRDEPNARLGRIVSLINLNRLKEAHKDSLELYKTHPQESVLDVIKHLYHWEGIPLDPKIFGPNAKVGQPSNSGADQQSNSSAGQPSNSSTAAPTPTDGPTPVRR